MDFLVHSHGGHTLPGCVAPRSGRRRPSLTRLAPAIAALVLASASAAAAGATDGQRKLDDTIRAAEIVFEGTIQSVEFRNARGAGGKPGIPHTFVTWQIHQIFKGKTQGARITARFLGGMPNPDELLALSHAPRPDVGDRDIVFLRRNGQSICPLVGCDDGRLRIVGGAVYGEGGGALSVRPDGVIVSGASSDDEGFARWEAVGIERVRGGDSAVDSPPGSESATDPAAMSVTSLRNLLQSRVAALYTPQQLARLRPVKSLDPEKEFTFRAPRAVAPPAVLATDRSESIAEGAPDSPEVAAYLEGGRNPVLPR